MFDLPATIRPARYAISVKNTLPGARFNPSHPEQSEEVVVTVASPPQALPPGNVIYVAGGDVVGLKVGAATHITRSFLLLFVWFTYRFVNDIIERVQCRR